MKEERRTSCEITQTRSAFWRKTASRCGNTHQRILVRARSWFRTEEASITDFKDLLVWQKAQAVAADLYRATQSLPFAERREIGGQIRRAASSVPANIAESRGRSGTRDRLQFLHIARGSARELESHLLLAQDIGLLLPGTVSDCLRRVDEIERMLSGLIRATR